ncbi:MAG: hypothetical protein KDA74_11685, partial [Planctomycetaceae bacterium]|nr:hypothetical protein [Planctomycetaceae bacterium]
MIRRSPHSDCFKTEIADRQSAWWLRVCLLLIVFCAPVITSAEDPTGSYFDGLRQRHLFGIAEGYCLNRLEQPRITDNERAR